jgi:hypothetical protein
MSDSAYCPHGLIGPCQECYEAEIKQLANAYHEKDAELASWQTSYLEVCRILGAIVAADGHCDEPAPYEVVLRAARDAVRDAGRFHEAEGHVARLESAIRREVALIPIEHARGLRAALEMQAGKGCSCKRDPSTDDMRQWDPSCDQHGDAP